MCGLPTETDEDVLQIAELAKKVIKAGREACRHPRHPVHGVDRRLRAQAAHAVPVGGPARPREHRPAPARPARRDPQRPPLGKAIGYRYHDGRPSLVEGLLSRGDRRVGPVILEAWRDGARFDGWCEHFSYDRWMSAAERALADSRWTSDWFTTRERDEHEVLPWDHLDSGPGPRLALAGLAGRAGGREVDDCRWTPCFDCGVCATSAPRSRSGPARP